MIPFNIDKVLERIDILTLMTSIFIASLSFLYFNSFIYFLIFFSGTYLVITIFISKIIKFIRDKYYFYVRNKNDRKQKEKYELYIKSIFTRLYKNNDLDVINWILSLPRDDCYENIFISNDIYKHSDINCFLKNNNLSFNQINYSSIVPLISYHEEGSYNNGFSNKRLITEIDTIVLKIIKEIKASKISK